MDINKYPVYKDLEPYKQYGSTVMEGLYDDIQTYLHFLENSISEKKRELEDHHKKIEKGLNIGNYFNIMEHQVSLMTDQLKLFHNQFSTYEKYHHVRYTNLFVQLKLTISKSNSIANACISCTTNVAEYCGICSRNDFRETILNETDLGELELNDSVVDPVEEPVDDTVVDPVEEPVDDTVVVPTVEPVVEVVEETKEEPVVEVVEETKEEPVVEVVEAVEEAVVEEAVVEVVEAEPVLDPVVEPVEESVEPVVDPVVEETKEEPVEEVVEEVVDPVKDPVVEPVVEPVMETVPETVEEAVAYSSGPVIDSIHDLLTVKMTPSLKSIVQRMIQDHAEL
jgi:hypothetical protein